MIKIAVFVKNLTSGGAEKQSVLLAKSFSHYYETHYIIFNGEKVHQKYMNMLMESSKIHIQYFKGDHFARYNALIKYLRQNNIKVIFSYLTAANLYACIAGKIVDAKVYTGLRNAKLPFLKCMVDKILTNYFAEKAISNSFSGKINFVKKGFNKNKIYVIQNCFENIKPYVAKEEKEIIHIITVGRFVTQKDYQTAIRAVAGLKKKNYNIIFDIIGYGELEANIREWVNIYEINDITHIYINPDNISVLLDNADIYLSTSLFEGTSNSIMEAMNADLPIVATNVGDNNYLVNDGYNGYLCNTKDYNKISNCLAVLVKDKDKRILFGKTSKQILQKNFSTNYFIKKYLKLINEKI